MAIAAGWRWVAAAGGVAGDRWRCMMISHHANSKANGVLGAGEKPDETRVLFLLEVLKTLYTLPNCSPHRLFFRLVFFGLSMPVYRIHQLDTMRPMFFKSSLKKVSSIRICSIRLARASSTHTKN